MCWVMSVIVERMSSGIVRVLSCENEKANKGRLSYGERFLTIYVYIYI